MEGEGGMGGERETETMRQRATQDGGEWVYGDREGRGEESDGRKIDLVIGLYFSTVKISFVSFFKKQPKKLSNRRMEQTHCIKLSMFHHFVSIHKLDKRITKSSCRAFPLGKKKLITKTTKM